ncbi:uncharacterized protein UBRO_20953 [Ustilago bromivora]|uniref:Uncharacterized protein n=1 Tax=Ustilago bromivora TaxID=307758 RepID=A0A1K0GYE4_9BASI|nr:uncharacterized protein UBRO_20953 [Ustilago bromivora]
MNRLMVTFRCTLMHFSGAMPSKNGVNKPAGSALWTRPFQQQQGHTASRSPMSLLHMCAGCTFTQITALFVIAPFAICRFQHMASLIICESMTLSLEQKLCCIDPILLARLQELANIGTIGSHGCRVSLPHHHHLLLCCQFRVQPKKRSMRRWHRQSRQDDANQGVGPAP